MIVAGIGCRRDTPAHDICAVIAAALETHGLLRRDVVCLATETAKAAEPGMASAAQQLGLPLVRCDVSALKSVSGHTLTQSERVEASKGVPSIAEAAALVVAGRGAKLLGPRIAHARATCALARAVRPPGGETR